MPLSWFDGTVDLTFEIALSSATSVYGAWDSDLWDSALWGPGAEWTDLSSRLRPDLGIDRAFSREAAIWGEGSASVVLRNTDGALSPANLTGPYAAGGVTQLRPGREGRILATYNGVTYPLYRGYSEDFEERWVDDDDPGAVVVIPMLDEMERLSRFSGAEQTPAGAGETSGARIERILNAAGHTGGRSIHTGIITVQATTLADDPVEELHVTTDSEGGALYIGPENEVVFEHRYGLLDNARSITTQATFGDGSGGLGEIPCSDIGTTYSSDLVRNIITYQREGGTAQVRADATSRALYRDRRETRTDLVCETDSQVDSLALWDLSRLREPEYRFTHVTIKPMTRPAQMFPVALGLRVRDLVRVNRPAPGGLTVSRDCFISGIHHQVQKDEWITRFDLVSATAYTAFSNSRWDTGTWDGVVWSF